MLRIPLKNQNQGTEIRDAFRVYGMKIENFLRRIIDIEKLKLFIKCVSEGHIEIIDEEIPEVRLNIKDTSTCNEFKHNILKKKLFLRRSCEEINSLGKIHIELIFKPEYLKNKLDSPSQLLDYIVDGHYLLLIFIPLDYGVNVLELLTARKYNHSIIIIYPRDSDEEANIIYNLDKVLSEIKAQHLVRKLILKHFEILKRSKTEDRILEWKSFLLLLLLFNNQMEYIFEKYILPTFYRVIMRALEKYDEIKTLSRESISTLLISINRYLFLNVMNLLGVHDLSAEEIGYEEYLNSVVGHLKQMLDTIDIVIMESLREYKQREIPLGEGVRLTILRTFIKTLREQEEQRKIFLKSIRDIVKENISTISSLNRLFLVSFFTILTAILPFLKIGIPGIELLPLELLYTVSSASLLFIIIYSSVFLRGLINSIRDIAESSEGVITKDQLFRLKSIKFLVKLLASIIIINYIILLMLCCLILGIYRIIVPQVRIFVVSSLIISTITLYYAIRGDSANIIQEMISSFLIYIRVKFRAKKLILMPLLVILSTIIIYFLINLI